MADEEQKKSGWGGWILGIMATAAVAIAAFIGIIAYRDGTVDRALGKQTRAGRRDDINKGKNVALAIANYENINGHLPANTYSPDGTPLLSWRVHILPYLEEGALYSKFKLDEPWNSPHNKELIMQMPSVFNMGASNSAQGLTAVQALEGSSGLHTAFKPEGKTTTLGEFIDGTANTALFIEAKDAVEWSRPQDVVVTPSTELSQKFASSPGHKAVMGMVDGSVQLMPEWTHENTAAINHFLQSAATKDGGEVLPLPSEITDSQRPTYVPEKPSAKSEKKSL